MTFHVGQQVARKRLPAMTDHDRELLNGLRIPPEGEAVTVSFVFGDRIDLVEYPNTDGWKGSQRGYLASAFRPLTKRKADISIFTRLLVPGTKIREDA